MLETIFPIELEFTLFSFHTNPSPLWLEGEMYDWTCWITEREVPSKCQDCTNADWLNRISEYLGILSNFSSRFGFYEVDGMKEIVVMTRLLLIMLILTSRLIR